MPEGSAAPVLSVEGYTLRYRTAGAAVTALDGVTLSIPRGETLGLVGESGSGKSSLAWAIMRYLPGNAVEDGGALRLSGDDLRQKTTRQMLEIRGRDIAMVFQDPSTSLNPSMRLGDQIAEVLTRHRDLTEREAMAESEALLERTGITHPAEMMRRYPHEASGGEKQRVVIATALACQPKLIIFDEPTTALDIITARQILELFARLKDETEVTALYISHDLGLVSRVADHVAVIHAGKIVENGTTRDIFTAPKDDYTVSLMNALPRPDVRLAGSAPPSGSARLSAQNITVRYGGSSVLWRRLGLGTEPFVGARDVSLSVKDGEFLGIVGESGSGKSTMAKALVGLTDFDGELRFGDALYGSRRAVDRRYRRAVQVVFQHPDASLNPRQSIGDILARPLKLYGLASGGDIGRRVASLLEMVRLPADFASRYPHQLSGGQKQRVAIARAFAAEPSVVVCDEITSSLDVSVQAAVARLLVELQEKSGTSCIFITHDINLIRQLAHRLAVMQRGEIVDVFQVEDAESTDRHPYTKALLAAVPVAPRPGRVAEGVPA